MLVDHALVRVGLSEGTIELSGTVGSLAERRRAIGNAYLNGIVDLFGSVGTVCEKHHAEDLAARINGVVGVNNYIVVSASSLSDPYPYAPT